MWPPARNWPTGSPHGASPPHRSPPLPVTQVVPDAVVEGPAPELLDEVRALHHCLHTGSGPRAAD